MGSSGGPSLISLMGARCLGLSGKTTFLTYLCRSILAECKTKEDVEGRLKAFRPLPAGLKRTICVDTWLILPVMICLSQRLSHARVSISFYTVKLRMAH